MRVLVAPAAYRGTLTAGEAAEAIAEGWRIGAPHDVTTARPLSDGGEGFLGALDGLPGARTQLCTVRGPAGEDVPAEILVVPGERTTAYVEAAQACGPALMPSAARDPFTTSSYGVGQLLAAALATGASRVVLGVRDLLCHDGGLGMLHALADQPWAHDTAWPDRLPDGEGLSWLPSLARSLVDVELVVATPEDLPLLGLQGASRLLVEERRASAEVAQELEAALGRLVDVVGTVMPPRTDLLTGRPLRPDKAPGAGAGGGVAHGLLLLGATVRNGAALVAGLVGLRDLVAAHDLVVTGEGTLGWTSLRGRVVAEVGAAGLEAVRPVVAIPGQSEVGRRETAAIGLAGLYPVAESLRAVPAAMADPRGSLMARATRVARTWSRG